MQPTRTNQPHHVLGRHRLSVSVDYLLLCDSHKIGTQLTLSGHHLQRSRRGQWTMRSNEVRPLGE